MVKDLLLQIAKKDKEAFKELYDYSYNKIFALIYRITRDRASSEELVHDTFVKIWDKAFLFLPIFNDERWILRIARNLAYDYLRKLKSKKDYESTLLYQKSLNPIDVSEIGVVEILSCLNEDEKIAITYKVAGYKQKEIAEKLGWKIDKIKNLNRNAKIKLDKYMNEDKK